MKSKAVEHVFRLCSIFAHENQQQTLGKHPLRRPGRRYDFRAQLVEKGKRNTLRYGASFLNGTDSATKSYRHMTCDYRRAQMPIKTIIET